MAERFPDTVPPCESQAAHGAPRGMGMFGLSIGDVGAARRAPRGVGKSGLSIGDVGAARRAPKGLSSVGLEGADPTMAQAETAARGAPEGRSFNVYPVASLNNRVCPLVLASQSEMC
jgi:hypothetical protein